MATADTEQWLTEGKCKDCRRRPYCQKSCTANKKAIMAMIRANQLREEILNGSR